MSSPYIYELGARRLPASIGGKAQKLCFLIRYGAQVPVTHVCTWEAYERYRDNDPEISAVVWSELQKKLDAGHLYAVRSSANIEDGRQYSFAGQFKTTLGVRGIPDIFRAMQATWAAAHGPGVKAYLAKSAIPSEGLKMAIIIQEMVQPSISGVSFSRNPITGMDEVIVEAVQGSGEALLQEGATPMRWINKWGAWIAEPDVQGIELGLIEEVVHQTKKIARAYGRPVDLEWVYDGRTLNWVQLREITALDVPVYSNRISREVFPGIIKPLIWSVNVPLVNGAWIRLLNELIGPHEVVSESLAAMFYYRAYFNMTTLGQIFEMLGLPREVLELLIGIEVEGPDKPSFRPTPRTYALMPRLLVFAADKLRFDKTLDRVLPHLHEQFHAFSEIDAALLNQRELLARIGQLFALVQEMAYYNIVTPLLMYAYNRILRGQLGRAGIEIESLDLTAGMEELSQYEPHVHLARLNEQCKRLDPSSQARIHGASYEEFCLLAGIESFQREVAQFIDQFGHLSDSGNDFSSVPWRENPDLILKMVVDYVPAQTPAGQKVRFDQLELSVLRRLPIGPAYRRARRFRWYREAISSLYTYGYGLFRNYYLALGDHFVRKGAIASRVDIFFLYAQEVREIAENDRSQFNYAEAVADRKLEIGQARDMQPPSIIYGDQEPPTFSPLGAGLRGIPTSRGHYTGPAKVLEGIEDFDRLEAGDVLVIPYSDVGWTPLFAKAGAVIAESGGILSHSSIVAREYNIPAVVSVPGACRLEDSTIVTVDGYRGVVILHESNQS